MRRLIGNVRALAFVSLSIWVMGISSPPIALASNAPTDEASTQEASTAGSHSCGPLALYVLGQFEGRRWSLASLESRLGRDRGSRFSFQDLREAASSRGLRLIGVRFSKEDWPLDRPALIHLETERDGHFMVVRPVGHSGTMVQVFDPVQGLTVYDVDDFFARKPTVNALIPIRLRESSVFRCGLVALGLLAPLPLMVVLRRERSRGSDPP